VDSVLLAFRGSWNGDFAPTPEDPLPSIPVPWPSYRPSCPHGNQVVVAHETINEAMSQGTFLRLTCVCGRITDYPFALLLQRRGVTRQTFLGTIRFRCDKCGRSEPVIGVHSQTQSSGQFGRPGISHVGKPCARILPLTAPPMPPM
jgi:hypothetical protein